MKRVATTIVAPLRLISRLLGLLLAALLLLGVGGLFGFFQVIEIQRDAAADLAMSAKAIANSVASPLERLVDLTDSFKPADFQGQDRIAMTTRLLRLQNALPNAAATFMVSSNGQLLAASGPFPSGEANVSEAEWFKRALNVGSAPLVLQRVDASWLRVGPTLIIARGVRDTIGKPVGLIGEVVRLEDFTRLLRPDWLGAGMSSQLLGTSGTPILEVIAPPVGLDSQSELDAWGVRVMSAVNKLAGGLSNPSISIPLKLADAAVAVSADADTVLLTRWQSRSHSLSILGIYLAGIWIICVALAILIKPHSPRIVAHDGFGSDWQLDLDKRGTIKAVHGYAPGRLQASVGRALLLAIGTSPEEDSGRAIAEALEARAKIDAVTVVLRTDDGHERFQRISIHPLADGGFICSGRDVTQEARAIAAADAAVAASHAAHQEAASVAHDRDRVLAVLGHDVRTPMNSIMGICSLLLDSELEQEQRIWLERIRASCEALLAMLNGLLEIASGEVGRAGLQAEEVDVIGLVQEVADVLLPQARDKGLELKTRYDELLYGQWLADPTRLRQVLFNLVGNAIKFTASGAVDVRASIVSDDAGRVTIKIAVSDTGPGIAPDDRANIFERFKRGHAGDVSGQAGLGLGLALCRENAALMGGTLSLESALGVGSEFTFEFPAERVSRSTNNLVLAGRTVLLIGDDEAKMQTIARLLAEAGLVVETAPDGYLGLAHAERLEAQRGALDMVIAQDNLGGMSAEAFLLRLRSTSFGRRAIVVWLGSGELSNVDATVALPFDSYQVASLAQQLLSERSPLEVLEPMASAARGGRILVVEDDKVNQSLLVAALTRRGFSTFVAGNGDEAVRLASRDSFDAILMDIQMPGLDGFEAARRIRSMPGRASTIPLIAITGLQGPMVRKRCTEAGFTVILEKPVNLDRLGATLRKYISGAAATNSDAHNLSESVGKSALGPQDYAADVSQVFLEEMVAVVGIERARACVTQFVADATARCMRLGELLPGWEADAIIRSCEEISGLAETCGAIGLGEVLEEVADAVSRNDRSRAEALVERLERVTARLAPAMAAWLDDIARRWSGRGNKAA